MLRLTDGEARQIAGIVGGLTYVPKVFTVEVKLYSKISCSNGSRWPQGAFAIGKTISALQLRTQTGASIVSIIEPNRMTRTNPEATTLLNEGATLILAGDRRSNAKLKQLLVYGKGD